MTIDELDTFFKSVELPHTIKLNRGETITDVKRFVDSHISTLRGNPGGMIEQAFYGRLIKLHQLLSESNPNL